VSEVEGGGSLGSSYSFVWLVMVLVLLWSMAGGLELGFKYRESFIDEGLELK
jgi:hypothetical protein